MCVREHSLRRIKFCVGLGERFPRNGNRFFLPSSGRSDCACACEWFSTTSQRLYSLVMELTIALGLARRDLWPKKCVPYGCTFSSRPVIFSYSPTRCLMDCFRNAVAIYLAVDVGIAKIIVNRCSIFRTVIGVLMPSDCIVVIEQQARPKNKCITTILCRYSVYCNSAKEIRAEQMNALEEHALANCAKLCTSSDGTSTRHVLCER